ncbi:zinc knuckle [Trichinella nativa]|uniref:Zinc knuckle n=1 Tax=Trichinella nativa TaxID=6335 RepID=A0A1Y3F2W8_9BILA|nr:zinc knuckle [Trichinella nativa]
MNVQFATEFARNGKLLCGKTKVSKSKPAIFDELLLRSRIHPVMITYTILRNMPDSFKKVIQTAAPKRRHSQASDESESAVSRRNRRHRQRSTCLTCMQVGHFRRDCYSHDGRQCKKTQKSK